MTNLPALDTKIFGLVHTKQEAALVCTELDMLFASLFSVRETAFSDVLAQIRPTTQTFLQQIANDNSFEFNNIEEWKALLPLWKDTLDKLKAIPITLSVSPTDEMLIALTSWIHTNIGNELIVDISIDPLIIGGAIVAFNGQYIDKSLKSAIATYVSHLKEKDVHSLGQISA